MPVVRVKSEIVNVALESVITGHRIFWCRLKTDPPVVLCFFPLRS